MTFRGDGADVRSANRIFRALADDRRRQSLDVLRDRTSSMGVGELSAYLTATDRSRSSREAGDDARERVATELVHTHLPLLEDAGLVNWDEQDETVTSTDHPAFQSRAFQRILELEVDGLDDVLLALSDGHRRFVLATLAGEESPTSRTTLVRALRRHQTGSPDPDTGDDISIQLHHVHLPKLDDLGLAEYDPVTGHVSLASNQAFDAVSAAFESNDPLIDRADGFLDGLGSAYRRASREVTDPFDWPRDWTDPHHG